MKRLDAFAKIEDVLINELDTEDKVYIDAVNEIIEVVREKIRNVTGN